MLCEPPYTAAPQNATRWDIRSAVKVSRNHTFTGNLGALTDVVSKYCNFFVKRGPEMLFNPLAMDSNLYVNIFTHKLAPN